MKLINKLIALNLMLGIASVSMTVSSMENEKSVVESGISKKRGMYSELPEFSGIPKSSKTFAAFLAELQEGFNLGNLSNSENLVRRQSLAIILGFATAEDNSVVGRFFKMEDESHTQTNEFYQPSVEAIKKYFDQLSQIIKAKVNSDAESVEKIVKKFARDILEESHVPDLTALPKNHQHSLEQARYVEIIVNLLLNRDDSVNPSTSPAASPFKTDDKISEPPYSPSPATPDSPLTSAASSMPQTPAIPSEFSTPSFTPDNETPRKLGGSDLDKKDKDIVRNLDQEFEETEGAVKIKDVKPQTIDEEESELKVKEDEAHNKAEEEKEEKKTDSSKKEETVDTKKDSDSEEDAGLISDFEMIDIKKDEPSDKGVASSSDKKASADDSVVEAGDEKQPEDKKEKKDSSPKTPTKIDNVVTKISDFSVVQSFSATSKPSRNRPEESYLKPIFENANEKLKELEGLLVKHKSKEIILSAKNLKLVNGAIKTYKKAIENMKKYAQANSFSDPIFKSE